MSRICLYYIYIYIKIEFLFFNSIYYDYNKNCAFYEKMVKTKFVDLFENNDFVSQHFFVFHRVGLQTITKTVHLKSYNAKKQSCLFEKD